MVTTTHVYDVLIAIFLVLVYTASPPEIVGESSFEYFTATCDISAKRYAEAISAGQSVFEFFTSTCDMSSIETRAAASADTRAAASVETRAVAPAEIRAAVPAETSADAPAETRAAASAEIRAAVPAETSANAPTETCAAASTETASLRAGYVDSEFELDSVEVTLNESTRPKITYEDTDGTSGFVRVFEHPIPTYNRTRISVWNEYILTYIATHATHVDVFTDTLIIGVSVSSICILRSMLPLALGR